MTRVLTLLVAVTMAGGLGCGVATADEAPISGTVKTVDTAANTLLLSKICGVTVIASSVYAHSTRTGPPSHPPRLGRRRDGLGSAHPPLQSKAE